jgi:hypothetical protein
VIAAAGRPAVMLERLRAALPIEPTFSRERTHATYRFETPISGERSLSLQKIGETWYLRD